MVDRNSVMAVIRHLTGKDNSIAVPHLFVKLMKGDWTAAAMLNQIVYWSGITKNPDGWFYKFDQEWSDELSISRHQAERCRGLFKSVGVKTKLAKVNGTPKLHFRVDDEEFYKSLTDLVERLSEIEKSDFPKNGNQTSPKTEVLLYTESTTKTTDLSTNVDKLNRAAIASDLPTDPLPTAQETTPNLKANTPPERKKVATKKEKPPTFALTDDVKNAFAIMCYQNEDAWKINAAVMGKALKQLADFEQRSITVDDLRAFRAWWKANDFRGQKKQPPKPYDVSSTWALYKGSLDPNAPTLDAPKPSYLTKPPEELTHEELMQKWG